MKGPVPVPITERFWRYVTFCCNTGCWLWTGTATPHRNIPNYWRPIISNGHKKSPMGASRLSYAMHRGKIPNGLFVLHTCDQPLCVNPDHLFLGDNSDNMVDCRNKGRLRPEIGAMVNAQLNQKITAEDRLCIGRDQTTPATELAKQYGVTVAWVSILRRRHRRMQ